MSAFGILIDLVGYMVARAGLPFLSFGRVYVEPFSTTPQRLSWPGYRRDEAGRIELRQRAAGWIGFGICLLVLIAIIAVCHGMWF